MDRRGAEKGRPCRPLSTLWRTVRIYLRSSPSQQDVHRGGLKTAYRARSIAFLEVLICDAARYCPHSPSPPREFLCEALGFHARRLFPRPDANFGMKIATIACCCNKAGADGEIAEALAFPP